MPPGNKFVVSSQPGTDPSRHLLANSFISTFFLRQGRTGRRDCFVVAVGADGAREGERAGQKVAISAVLLFQSVGPVLRLAVGSLSPGRRPQELDVANGLALRLPSSSRHFPFVLAQ